MLLLSLASQGVTLGLVQLLLCGFVSPNDSLKPSWVLRALGDQPLWCPPDEQYLFHGHSGVPLLDHCTS